MCSCRSFGRMKYLRDNTCTEKKTCDTFYIFNSRISCEQRVIIERAVSLAVRKAAWHFKQISQGDEREEWRVPLNGTGSYILRLRDIGIPRFYRITLDTFAANESNRAQVALLSPSPPPSPSYILRTGIKIYMSVCTTAGGVHVRACIAPPAPRHKLPGMLFPACERTRPTAPKHTARIRRRNRDYRSGRLWISWKEGFPFDKPCIAARPDCFSTPLAFTFRRIFQAQPSVIKM